MTSSRLFCNWGILLQNLRQHGWIGIMYTLTLLFAGPSYLLSSYFEVPRSINSLFEANGDTQAIFVLIFPVAAGIFLFRYVQSNTLTLLFHSLPLRREHILSTKLITGLIIVLVPVWFTTGVMALVWSTVDLSYLFDATAIWMWGLTLSVFSIFLFIFTVFVGMCIGHSILQGISVYVLITLPVVMSTLLRHHLRSYLPGYPDDSARADSFISPLIRLSHLEDMAPQAKELMVYGILIVSFTLLTYILYKARQVETATQSVTFVYLKPIFRIVIMLGSAMVVETYLSLKFFKWVSIGTAMGYVAGGIVGYLIAEMILQKTWQIWTRRNLQGLVLYGVITGLILYVPVASWNGYAARIPDTTNIQSVSIGGPYPYRGITPEDDDELYSKDPAYIQMVRSLHSRIIAAHLPLPTENSSLTSDYENLLLNYKLSDGTFLKRAYWVPRSQFTKELNTLESTDSYKRSHYQMYRLDRNLSSIQLRSLLLRERAIILSDPQEIREFQTLLKEEILQENEEELHSDIQPVAEINLFMQGKEMEGSQLNIKQSYSKIEAWLKQKGLLDRIKVSSEQITSAQIIRQVAGTANSGQNVYVNEDMFVQSDNGQIITRDKQIIGDILSRSSSSYEAHGTFVYYIKFDMASGQTIYTFVQDKHAPRALSALFKK